ncbi:hypothetical protein N9W89_00315 [Hellea sp.]|nr:hypothetical protein [Hellea sp.]
MDEPTSKPAFNNTAAQRIVNVTQNRKKSKPSKYKAKTYQPTPISKTPLIKLDPKSQSSAPVLTLDVEKYLHQFKDFVMTEDEKLEVLNDLWNIMCRFVEIGFGMDSHTLACEQRERDSRIKDGTLVNLNHLNITDNERKDCS